MIYIFKTDENNRLQALTSIEKGCWVHLVKPTEAEIQRVISETDVLPEFVQAALDDEERARIETDEGQTLIVVDTPFREPGADAGILSTIPVAMIILPKVLLTVCLYENTMLDDFVKGRVRNVETSFKTRTILQMLYRNATRFMVHLRQISKQSREVEEALHLSTENKELIQMMSLQKSLIYFSTALKSNEVVLEKMVRHEQVKNYPEDAEILEDVIIENKQAIEMTDIYSNLLTGTMDAFASIISNNLNIVMRFLASVTIVLAIPTMVASFYGMNISFMPFTNSPFSFFVIIMLALLLGILVAFWLKRRKMF
jgi:magnesium transporter